MAVVSLVGDSNALVDVGSDVERRFELGAVASLARGQVEVERMAAEIGLDVDSGRKSTARATERLMVLPPLVLAAETCVRSRSIENCIMCAV